MRATPDPRIRSEPVEGMPRSEVERRIALNQFARQIEEEVTSYLEQSTAYLAQKQADAAEAARRAHDFQVLRHNTFQKMLWTILGFMLFMMMSCLALSLWMIASGREQGGIVLALATIGGLAYLARFGAPRRMWWRGAPDSEMGG